MDPNHVLKEYREAELFGQRSEKDHDACKNQYKGCPFSVFKIVKLTSLFEKWLRIIFFKMSSSVLEANHLS